MGKYLLAYTGGRAGATEQERNAAMAAWGSWLGGLGESLLDAGNPFGPSGGVAADGSVSNGATAGLTGYSIVAAEDLNAAAKLTQGCPIFAGGGGVEVYETIEIM